MNPPVRFSCRMIAFSSAWIVTLLLGGPNVVRAADKATTADRQSGPAMATAKATDAKPAPPRDEPTMVVTGSRIPQKISRLGPVPTTAAPISIITQEQLARTGSPTLAGALRKSVFH